MAEVTPLSALLIPHPMARRVLTPKILGTSILLPSGDLS